MKIILSYINPLLLVIIFFSSCQKNDGDQEIQIEYKGEHKISIERIEVSGFGSLKVSGLFNVTYDPSITDIGFILYQNDKIVEKISLDKNDLSPKESAVFNKLESGQYKVVSYINNKTGQIISLPKEVILNVDKSAGIFLSSYNYDYETDSGQYVVSKNEGDNLFIFILSEIPLIPDQMQLMIGDKTISSAEVQTETGWTDDYYHYNFRVTISEEVPDGRNEIKFNLDKSIDLLTINLFLDKLNGTWKQLGSLFTGDIKSNKIAFQNETSGFLVQSDYFRDGVYEFQTWRMDFSTLKWRQVSSFSFNEHDYVAIESHRSQITIGNKAYILLSTAQHGNSPNIYKTKNFKEIWEYNMDTDKWIRKTKIEGDFSNSPIVFAFKNKFYIVGGWYYNPNNIDDTILLNKQWIYDPLNNSLEEEFVTLPFVYGDGSDYSVFESPNYAYCITGSLEECRVMRYSDKTKEWEILKTPYPKMTKEGVGYFHNDLLYYLGGIASGNIGVHKYAYTFSEKENKWQQIPDFPHQFRYGLVYHFNNKIYVGLGEGVYEARVSLFSLE